MTNGRKETKVTERSRMTHAEIEEGRVLALDFDKLQKVASCGQALMPVAVQEADSGEVLLVAHANQQALEHTLEKGVATFWSTSRNELWIKGATSGDFLDLVEVRVNCEQNALLYRVRLRGKGACHTRGENGVARRGCFYRRIHRGGLGFVP
jgi:phosphoribosyl-AMP cyclohydrolase